MHEMSLAEGVLNLIEDSAAANGFTRVRTVWLEIGDLAAVEPEAMRFCFDAVVKGTVAEGARIEIVAIEGQGWCDSCGQTVSLRLRYDLCPRCGGPVRATGGMEMRVKELEVE